MRGVGKCTTQDRPAGTLSLDDQERLTVELPAITARRAVIEQATSMLMFVYGVDVNVNEAFYVLREQSQNHNVELLLVTERVVKDIVELA
jgi:AmiR/NasT family two-component response regulator